VEGRGKERERREGAKEGGKERWRSGRVREREKREVCVWGGGGREREVLLTIKKRLKGRGGGERERRRAEHTSPL
jgi:hypothetical protein